jgi:hypothetical protein
MDRPVRSGLRMARAVFLSLVLTRPALAVSVLPGSTGRHRTTEVDRETSA